MPSIKKISKLFYIQWSIYFLAFCFAQVFLMFPLVAFASTSLLVDISVNPASGPAPLNNVDLTVSVSGTASGNITYRFDCTNNGSWERTHTTSNTSYTAYDLCDYSSAGNYTAKVKVERGGLVFQGTIAILVESGSVLSVDLSANPSSGKAPLNNVDLTATVLGSATGNITYRFDCTNNGSWERTHTTSNTSYTANNLCDYSSTGNYTAKVKVERGGLTFQGTTAIVVHSGDVSYRLEKLARNISEDQNTFKESITAEPSDRIEFQIRVTSIGEATAEDTFIKDTLPQLLINKGNLKINGNSSSKNIFSGFSLGDLSSGETKTITFEVEVASKEKFSFGTTGLINTVTVYNEKAAATEAITVSVERKGVAGAATGVSTGFFSLSTLALIITLLMGFLFTYFMLLRFYVTKHVMPKAFEAKAERILLRKVVKIKEEESIM